VTNDSDQALRVYVDPWDPGYGTALSRDMAEGMPDSSARVNVNLELRPDDWAPLNPPPGTQTPKRLYIVDGVRRIDASVWYQAEDLTAPALGLAASWAAGVVRLDGAAEVVSAQVRRAIFSGYPQAVPLRTSAGDYPVGIAADASLEGLTHALQESLLATEQETSAAARGDDPEALLLVDGPLLGRAHLANAVGYIKTHQASYLPPELNRVVGSLAPGQRTPAFTIGTSYSRHTWYVRLPGGTATPWSGVIRCECSDTLPGAVVTQLADTTATLLPILASERHKDPRAPQNLTPIGGLERQLRHVLGDPRLLHRALVRATSGL
jgi:hypothetical protein